MFGYKTIQKTERRNVSTQGFSVFVSGASSQEMYVTFLGVILFGIIF